MHRLQKKVSWGSWLHSHTRPRGGEPDIAKWGWGWGAERRLRVSGGGVKGEQETLPSALGQTPSCSFPHSFPQGPFLPVTFNKAPRAEEAVFRNVQHYTGLSPSLLPWKQLLHWLEQNTKHHPLPSPLQNSPSNRNHFYTGTVQWRTQLEPPDPQG